MGYDAAGYEGIDAQRKEYMYKRLIAARPDWANRVDLMMDTAQVELEYFRGLNDGTIPDLARNNSARLSRRVSAGEGAKPYKNGLSNGTDTGANGRKRIITSHRVTDLTVKYGNFYAASSVEAVGPNDITVRAAIKLGSTFYPLYFRGQRDVIIKPGTVVESDSLGIDILAGTSFYVMTYVTVTAGQKWGLGSLYVRGGNYGEDYVSTASPTDLTTTDGITAGSNQIGYGPMQVLSRNTNLNPYVVILGDSISDGTGDTATINGIDGYERGWIVRGLVPDFPIQVFSQPGIQGTQAVYNNIGRRMDNIGDAEIAIIAYGANDLGGLKTFSQIQAGLQYIYDYCAARGMKVFGSTITPKTSSTDAWSTVGNQTQSYSTAVENTRTAINDWIRSLPSPLTGYFDVADVAETSRNSGFWRVDLGQPTSDGLHPLSVMHDAMSRKIDKTKLKGL